MVAPQRPDSCAVSLLTVPQAAAALAVSERTVRSMIAAGALPIVRVGRAIRIHSDDLRAFVEERRGVAGNGRGARK